MSILCNAKVGSACLMTVLPHGSKSQVSTIALMSGRLQDKAPDPGSSQGNSTKRNSLDQKADKAAKKQRCSDSGELQCDN